MGRQRVLLLGMSLSWAVLIPLTILAVFFFPNWRWENQHALLLLDEVEATLCIIVGVLLLLARKIRREATAFVIWSATALLVLGVTWEIRTFVEEMASLVWLGSTSRLVGAALFTIALTPLCRKVPIPRYSRTWALLLTIIVCLIGIIFSEWLPSGIVDNHLYTPVRIMYLVSAIGYLVPALYFVIYQKLTQRRSQAEEILVVNIALYFGLSALLIAESNLWNVAWWLPRFLQVILFISSLSYIFIIYQKNQEVILASEERFRKVFEESPMGIGLVGKDYRFASANPALCQLLGRSQEELAETPIRAFTHADDLYPVLAEHNRLLRGEIQSYHFENRWYHSSGRILWTHLSGAPIRNNRGRIQHVLLLVQDVSERVLTHQRTRDLIDRLSRTNADLEQFAHLASHDLKIPMNTISNYVEMLQSRYGSLFDAKAHHYMTFIVNACERMGTLVDDLLNFSRRDHKKIRRDSVDTSSLVQEVLSNLSSEIEAKAAVLSVERLPVVKGDRSQLFQVFQNLISNAVKFSGKEKPRVRIWAEESDPEWKFAVTDNGVGVDSANSLRIFEPLQKLHSDDKYPGTGLGLAISRSVVERHGGRIWVESETGKGSTFYFTLPKFPETEKETAETVQPNSLAGSSQSSETGLR